jgi:hypothetical protein
VAWERCSYYTGHPRDAGTADPIRAFAILWGYRLRGGDHARYEDLTHEVDGLTGLQAITDIWCRLASQSMLHDSDVVNMTNRLDVCHAALIPEQARQHYVRYIFPALYTDLQAAYPANFCKADPMDSTVLKYFKRFYEAVCRVIRTDHWHCQYTRDSVWESDVWLPLTTPTKHMLHVLSAYSEQYDSVMIL